MNRFLLDTHIWIWYLLGSKQLPSSIKERIDHSLDSLWLSPISVWETIMLAKRGRIQLGGEPGSWVRTALVKMPVNEASMNLEVALKSQEIELSHKDPADHFLAATALVYDLTLVTVDRRLTSLDWLPAYTGSP